MVLLYILGISSTPFNCFRGLAVTDRTRASDMRGGSEESEEIASDTAERGSEWFRSGRVRRRCEAMQEFSKGRRRSMSEWRRIT